MHTTLRDITSASGIWSGSRRDTHAFLLSPDVYAISRGQKDELERLGFALFDCLRGLSHIAAISHGHSNSFGPAWAVARRVLTTGIPTVYQELQGIRPEDIPRLLKLDLMVDREGRFRIAEIDGHNKHGLGYSTLGKRFREAVRPDAKALPGAVKVLADEIRRQGFGRLKVFYADQERFYRPEFEILEQELGAQGIECDLFSEEVATDGLLSSGLFLDLPFLYGRPELYGTIVPAYKAGAAKFVIPPKPCFGAKGVLALLRNDVQDPQTEAILQAFIKASSLKTVRGFIPETILVGKRAASSEEVKRRTAAKRYVLKESISSGMHGTVFSGGEDFDAMLLRAGAANMNWILQEEVDNQPQTFSWFEGNGAEGPQLRTADGWFMRVTVHYVNHALADVIVTARRDKAVHGAKDCLQLGTVIA